MSAREQILAAIRKNQPAAVELPVVDTAVVISYTDPVAQFKSVLQAIGGTCIEAANQQEAEQLITDMQKGTFVMDTRYVAPPALAAMTSLELASVDTAIITGRVAVAENGAIWVSENEMISRLLPFIAQQLVIVISEKQIVPTMHHAYAVIKTDETGFGAFIAGPSKTADIEQSLVIGAHGPCGMTAVVVRE